jgi:uncharacterized membrane protein
MNDNPVFQFIGYIISAVIFTVPLIINGVHKKQYVLTGIFAVICSVIGYLFGFIAAMGVFFVFLMILAVIENKKKKQM